jgi:hypothetical protein
MKFHNSKIKSSSHNSLEIIIRVGAWSRMSSRPKKTTSQEEGETVSGETSRKKNIRSKSTKERAATERSKDRSGTLTKRMIHTVMKCQSIIKNRVLIAFKVEAGDKMLTTTLLRRSRVKPQFSGEETIVVHSALVRNVGLGNLKTNILLSTMILVVMRI